MLRRLNEETINTREIVGASCFHVEKEIKGIIDLTFGQQNFQIDYDFFDIKGTVLIYGIPGIGKTTVMNNCLRYALDKYEIDCYTLEVSKIIDSLLGKATKNLSQALSEFEEKEEAILFIDEIDRLCINRRDDDVSELKRMLIELMQFFDRISISKKKMVLCCTNVVDQLDEALLRRFSIMEKVESPSSEEVTCFANTCLAKSGMPGKITKPRSTFETLDQVKAIFRSAIINHDNEIILNAFEMEDE